MSATDIPDGAYTLLDDEGVGYTRDAMRAAFGGEVVWCVDSERHMDDPEALAVMISPQRYKDLLETEWMYGDLRR